MSSIARTGPPGEEQEGALEAQVEYGLMRNATVQDVKKGRSLQTDVCDAHPELLRAARNVGRRSNEQCPICDDSRTVRVTYVFGAGLPPGGTCPGTVKELNRLRRRPEPVQCYEVEVCPDCAWHYLVRRYPGGGANARRSPIRRAAPSS